MPLHETRKRRPDARRQTAKNGELPSIAKDYLLWYPFISRMPTTIFWLSLAYALSFSVLTLFVLLGLDLAGVWLGLYYVGLAVFVAAGYLGFAGWIARGGRRGGGPPNNASS